MYLMKKCGIWYIFWRDSNGKIRSKSTGTKNKSEALKYLQAFKTKQEHESKLTLGKLIKNFLIKSETNYTAKSYRDIKATASKFLSVFGEITVPEINRENINTFLGMFDSIYQKKKHLTNLSALFQYAKEGGAIEINPCRLVKLQKLPEKLPVFFSADEFKALLEVIDSEVMRDIATLAIKTGLRQMELLTLRQSQIINRNIILTNQNALTKSKRVRSVPLNDEALEIIKKYKGDILFPYTQNYITKKFKTYVLKARIDGKPINPKLNFHSLRHTFASRLVQAGVPIYTVSKLLGHANVKTTEIYSHLNPANLIDAVKLI